MGINEQTSTFNLIMMKAHSNQSSAFGHMLPEKWGLILLGLTLLLVTAACVDRVKMTPVTEAFVQETAEAATFTPKGDTVELTPIPGPDGGELRCKTVTVDAREVRDLSRLIDLGIGNLYPGAIIQGGELAEGKFVNVDIETEKNTLIVDGLSGGQDVTREVSSLSEVDVKEGINDLLNDISGTVEGTSAEFSYVVEQAFSQEEFQFHAGLGIGFPLADITASLYNANSTRSSRVMLQFNQKFYSISIESPEDEYALFRKDERTRIQNTDQISSGNPPLYVKTVHYGRQIFFLAESDYSTRDLEASLDAAYRGSGPEFTLESGFTAGEILDNSKITYVVRGGGAGIALQNAPSFEAVQEVIQKGANWGLSNPGAPIAYELRYLTNEPAYMEFSSIFERKECELLPAPSPGPFSFQAEQIASFADLPTPTKMYTGDFNGDGLEDILLNHLGSTNTLKIGLGSASGQIDFQPAVSHPASNAWSQYQTHVGDFDGDGRDDVAWTFVDNTENRSLMALSQGGASWDFLAANLRTGAGWEDYDAVVADTDNNGKDELIFNRLAAGENNSVWSTELDASLNQYDWVLLYDQQGNWGNHEVSVGNVDGGGEDLIWQSLGTDNKLVYYADRGPGSNSLTRNPFFSRQNVGWNRYSSRIINGNTDARSDLLYYNPTNNKVRIYLDLADGSANGFMVSNFQDIERESDFDWEEFELLAGDVNGDGIEDLIWTDESDGLSNNLIITGLGTSDGKFDFETADMQHPEAETWGQYTPLLLDVNGDRSKDLVYVKPGTNASIYVALAKD